MAACTWAEGHPSCRARRQSLTLNVTVAVSYIPHISLHVLESNDKLGKDEVKLNLQGIAMGNPNMECALLLLLET